MLHVVVYASAARIGTLRIVRLKALNGIQREYVYRYGLYDKEDREMQLGQVKHRYSDGWIVLVNKVTEALMKRQEPKAEANE